MNKTTVKHEQTNFMNNIKLQITKKKVKQGGADDIQNHFLMAMIGHRNSGKTYSCVLFCKHLIDANIFNKDFIFIISPTYGSNSVYENLDIPYENIYEDVDTLLESIEDIKEKIKIIKAEWLEYENEYPEVYDIYRDNPLDYMEYLTTSQIHMLDKNGYKPYSRAKYGGFQPMCLLILDDLQSTIIYSTSRKNPFNNLLLRHRHIEGIGLSIIMLCQTFKSGCNRIIRQNITQYCLWANHDEKALIDMWQEILGSKLKYNDFIRMYNYALEGSDHNFLFIDLNPKDKLKYLRKNFNTYIYT